MQWSRRQACASLGTLLFLPALSTSSLAAGSLAAGSLAAGSPAAGRPPAGRDPSAFLAAVRRGELEAVRRLLAEDAALARARDELGRSAYTLAWVHGHVGVGDLIRAALPELDIVEAVFAEDWERVEVLAEAHPEQLAGAHPIGGTPLYAAALGGSLDFWRLRSLGCESDARPAGGSGFSAARGAMESAHESWARISLSDLCSNGADVNAKQAGGSSVLHGAVLRRSDLLVRLAIRKGADVDAVDDEGRTARALAAKIGWQAGAELLAGHAALPRDNRSSRFALNASREPVVRADLSDVSRELQSEVTGNSHFRLERVRELVSADERLVFSISTDDELAIEASAHLGSRDIIRYHLDHGAPLSLPTAVSLGDTDMVKFWLERDASLMHERGAHDFPVMWYAVLGGGSVAMAELLAGYGVPLDQNSMGTTALHWCVRRKDRDLAQWLIEHGADPEAVGHKWSRAGQTPLQVATETEATQMAALLKDAGAKR